MNEETTRMLDQAVEHIKDRRPDLYRPRGDIEMAMASVVGALKLIAPHCGCDLRLERAIQRGHLGEIDRPVELILEVIEMLGPSVKLKYRNQIKETLSIIKKSVEEAS